MMVDVTNGYVTLSFRDWVWRSARAKAILGYLEGKEMRSFHSWSFLFWSYYAVSGISFSDALFIMREF